MNYYLDDKEQGPNQASYEYPEIAEPEKEPRWSIFQGIVVFIICYAFISTISLIATFALYGGDYAEITPEMLIISSVIQSLAFIGASYFVARQYYPGLAWAKLGFCRAPKISDLGQATLTAVVLYVVVLFINAIFTNFIVEDPQMQDSMELLMNSDNLLSTLGIVLCLVVLAPLSEELFFRGFLYPAMRKKWGVTIGALVSGFLFSLVHFDLVVLVSFTLLGAVFAILYEKTGSLWGNIIAHAIFNGISVFLLLVSAQYL